MGLASYLRSKFQFYSAKDVNPFWLTQKSTSQYVKIDNKHDILHAYNSCSTLKSIVDHSAEVFSRGLFYIEKNGKIIENHFLLDFFKNTSVLQNSTFKKDYAKQIQLYNICVILKQSPILTSNKGVKNLLVLDYDKTTVIIKDQYKNIKDLSEVKNINEIINKVEYKNENGNIEYFLPNDIIIISNNKLYIKNNKLTVNHKLISAEQCINVLISAYEVRIYYNRKRGGAFLITKKPLNAGVNETVLHKDDEEKALKKALNSQFSGEEGSAGNTVFTNQAYDTKAMTLPISTLGINDGIQQAKTELCDLLNFPLPLLNNLNGTTFNNKASADRQLITNLIIPMFETLENKINSEFNLNQEKFTIDYSHFEALQPDKKTKIDAENAETNMIINLNEKVKNGIITREIAIDILVYNYDYTEEIAKKRIIKIS